MAAIHEQHHPYHSALRSQALMLCHGASIIKPPSLPQLLQRLRTLRPLLHHLPKFPRNSLPPGLNALHMSPLLLNSRSLLSRDRFRMPGTQTAQPCIDLGFLVLK